MQVDCSFCAVDVLLGQSRLTMGVLKRWNQQHLDLALVAMHSCPHIQFNVGGVIANFSGRTVGMFTGSRSAAAAGRFPLLDIASLRLRHWQQLGLDMNGPNYCIAEKRKQLKLNLKKKSRKSQKVSKKDEIESTGRLTSNDPC